MKLRKEFRTERGYLEVYRAQINGDSFILKAQLILFIILFIGGIIFLF